ncbi:MAG: 6-phosphogluconate dehydrogenase [Bacteroidota bacterium]|nr:6-phosphogluconate dehydrogenase [Bacteroidota bacterium]MDP3144527.1 6-phosphogluconate dehydrogenase [Bacteroidota bacterium]MDP3558231.1 6-phosphogluconate dehydrogenase [Bacteroidota bacterium]
MNDVNSNIPVKPKKTGKFKKFGFITLLILVLAAVIYYFICGMTFSEGTRSGILTKVSKKGYLFKTYEGELNVGGINQGEGTILPVTIFKFSTTKKQIYDSLEVYQGRKVVLKYKQVIKNFFWQGDTDYFIEHVSLMK